jgi:hypothetical protein
MIWRQVTGKSGDDDEVRKVDVDMYSFLSFFMKTTRAYKLLLLLCLETVSDRCSK